MLEGMQGPKDDGRIDKMKNRLYSRRHEETYQDVRSDVKPKDVEVKETWDKEGIKPAIPLNVYKKPKRFAFTNKLFIASVVFFVLSSGVAAFMYFGGLNLISPKNVNISVQGPVSVAGGEEFALDIIVENNNSVDLNSVVLTVNFPDGAKVPGNLTQPLILDKEEIGTIKAGESARRTVKAVLFGEKDSIQEIKINSTYGIANSNAQFQKEKAYQIAIKSAPILLSVDYPSEVNVNQDMEFKIHITSNTNSELDNVVMRAEYPFGFVFDDVEPKAYYDNNVWHLGTLKPLESRDFILHGHLEAQNNEERTFRFTVGKQSEDDDRQIGIQLTSLLFSITTKQPFVSLDIYSSVPQTTTGEYILKAGQSSPIQLRFQNNLPTNIFNADVSAKFTGAVLEKRITNIGENGYYKSSDSVLLWDKFGFSDLSEITPGAQKVVGFSLTTLEPTADLIRSIPNPEFAVEVKVHGTRLENGVPEDVEANQVTKVRVQSKIELTAKDGYFAGPFKNSGPFPPKVDTETTYTVKWSVTNTWNSVASGRVVATLPPYVRWMGTSSPSNENISFNPLTREVVWDMGDIKRGLGLTEDPRTVYFTLGVTPSLSHLGNSPVILNESTISGRDKYTGVELSAKSIQLRTLLNSGDPRDVSQNADVVQ